MEVPSNNMNPDLSEDFMDDYIESDSESDTFEISDDIDIDDVELEIEDTDTETNDNVEDFEEDNSLFKEKKVISKHRQSDKHSLERDVVFLGKKEILTEENDTNNDTYHNENYNINMSSYFYYENFENESYVRDKKLKEKIFDILKIKTDLDFSNNRRKPSRADFNIYYGIIKDSLKDERYTHVEIFNELAVYFSDNLFNIFKLLEPKYVKLIITELEEHVGKQNPNAKRVAHSNLTSNAEIEFKTIRRGKNILATGIIIDKEYDYDINTMEESVTYVVDSMEKIHYIQLEDIVKILNNNKYKYNINRLKNIDFL